MGVGSDRGLAPPQQSRERLSEGARATERGSKHVSLSHSYHHNRHRTSTCTHNQHTHGTNEGAAEEAATEAHAESLPHHLHQH